MAVVALIPSAREQLLVAIEDIGSSAAGFATAASSADPRERNKLAAVERLFEELVNRIDELAERALAEARRRHLAPKSAGPPYAALAGQRVISRALADQLEQAKDLRDMLQHGYPPRDWETAHAAIAAFPRQLDRFLDGCGRWLKELDLLP